MPDPLTLSALIAGGSALGGGIGNAISTQQQNDASRAFAAQMYRLQRRDAYQFWNDQNEYNSPKAQMQRFEQAGLNPHLIYGQGNSGPAGAISTPDVQTPQFRSPEWGNAISAAGASTLSAIYDFDIKQAQTDNLRLQGEVLRQEALLKAAQVQSTLTGTEKTKFGLDFERGLVDVSAEARREQLRQLKTNIDLSLNKDAREAALNSSHLKEAVERMANAREQRLNMQLDRTRTRSEIQRIHADKARIYKTIELMEKDGVIKDLEIELRKQGINPNDPMWARLVGRFLANFFDDDQSFKSSTGNIWKWLFR